MNQHELRLFLELSDSLHYGRTSRKCNISPSALSRAIQRLEEEVGTELFSRDNRSVVLTESGEVFRNYAVGIIDQWEEVKNRLSTAGTTLHGELSLYCSVTACYSILPDILQRFREIYPGIHIKLQTGDAASAVPKAAESEVDIAIAARPEVLKRNLDFKPIARTPLLFIAPDIPCEVQQMAEAGIPDWSSIPMILSEKGLARQRVDAWFREWNIKPLIYAQVSGNEAILAMVRVGCGAGVVPGLVLEKSAVSGEVRVLDIDPPLEPYTVGLVAQRRRLASPLVSAFWNLAAQEKSSIE